jgi:lipoprotein-releasing system permease protein
MAAEAALSIALQVAVTHVLARRRQSVVSVLGVTLGVGFFVGASALLQGSQNDMVSRLVDTAPHITISDEYRTPLLQPVAANFAGGAVELRGAKPRDAVRGIKDSPAMIATLETWPGVAAAPALSGQAIVRFGGRDVAATINGIDMEREPRVSNLARDMVRGRLEDLRTAANGIIVGEAMARDLDATVGDTLTVTAPSGVVLKMKLVGLFRTGVAGADRGRAYALLKKAQVLLERPNVINRVRLRLADHTQARDLAQNIEARYRYRSESWQEANEDLLGLLVVRNIILYTIVTAILIVASFGIYNVVSTVVHEKTRDIAILKSMGFTQRDIRHIFLWQGALVGTFGAASGWVLGFVLVRILGSVEIRLRGLVDVQHLPVDQSFVHYAIAGGFALLAATLASYLPARRAAQLRPVEILRGAA